jgi:hypothetical protein
MLATTAKRELKATSSLNRIIYATLSDIAPGAPIGGSDPPRALGRCRRQ